MEEKKAIFVKLPKDIYKRFKIYCVQNETTMEKLLPKILDNFLKERGF